MKSVLGKRKGQQSYDTDIITTERNQIGTCSELPRSRKSFKRTAPNHYAAEGSWMMNFEGNLSSLNKKEFKTTTTTEGGPGENSTIGFKGGILEETSPSSGDLFRDAIVALLHETKLAETPDGSIGYELVGIDGKVPVDGEPRFIKTKTTAILCPDKESVRSIANQIGKADPKLTVLAVQDTTILMTITFGQIIEADAIVMLCGFATREGRFNPFYSDQGFSSPQLGTEYVGISTCDPSTFSADNPQPGLDRKIVESLLFFMWRRAIFVFGKEMGDTSKQVKVNAMNRWVVTKKPITQFSERETCFVCSILCGETVSDKPKRGKRVIIANKEDIKNIKTLLRSDMSTTIERKHNLPIVKELQNIVVYPSPEEEFVNRYYNYIRESDPQNVHFESWQSLPNCRAGMEEYNCQNVFAVMASTLEEITSTSQQTVHSCSIALAEFIEACKPAVKLLESVLGRIQYYFRNLRGEDPGVFVTEDDDRDFPQMVARFLEGSIQFEIGDAQHINIKIRDFDVIDDNQIASIFRFLREYDSRKSYILEDVLDKVLIDISDNKMPSESRKAYQQRTESLRMDWNKLGALVWNLEEPFANLMGEMATGLRCKSLSYHRTAHVFLETLGISIRHSFFHVIAAYQWCCRYLNGEGPTSLNYVPVAVENFRSRFAAISPKVKKYFSGGPDSCGKGEEFCVCCRKDCDLFVHLLSCGHVCCHECALACPQNENKRKYGEGPRTPSINCTKCGLVTDLPMMFANRSRKFIAKFYHDLSEGAPAPREMTDPHRFREERVLFPFSQTVNEKQSFQTGALRVCAHQPEVCSKIYATIQLLLELKRSKTVVYCLNQGFSKGLSVCAKKKKLRVAYCGTSKKAFQESINKFNSEEAGAGHKSLDVLVVCHSFSKTDGHRLVGVNNIIYTFGADESAKRDLLACIEVKTDPANIDIYKVSMAGREPRLLKSIH